MESIQAICVCVHIIQSCLSPGSRLSVFWQVIFYFNNMQTNFWMAALAPESVTVDVEGKRLKQNWIWLWEQGKRLLPSKYFGGANCGILSPSLWPLYIKKITSYVGVPVIHAFPWKIMPEYVTVLPTFKWILLRIIWQRRFLGCFLW